MYLNKAHAFISLIFGSVIWLIAQTVNWGLGEFLKDNATPIYDFFTSASGAEYLASFLILVGVIGLCWPKIRSRLFSPDCWVEYTPTEKTCYYDPQRSRKVSDFIVRHQYDANGDYMGHTLNFWFPHRGKVSHAFAKIVGVPEILAQEELALESGGGMIWVDGDNWDKRIRVDIKF